MGRDILMQYQKNGLTVELVQGDITQLSTDAITNPANSYLQLGAGVADAIARQGGAEIQRECDVIGYCEVGNAVITSGGNLKAKYVIHAVGPRMGEGDEVRKLTGAIRTTLELADAENLPSVALPAISTGIFGFPITKCAEIMAEQMLDFAQAERQSVQKMVACLYDQAAFDVFAEAFARIWKGEVD